jgi:hypothetical protein
MLEAQVFLKFFVPGGSGFRFAPTLNQFAHSRLGLLGGAKVRDILRRRSGRKKIKDFVVCLH